MTKYCSSIMILLWALSPLLWAEVQVPSIFGDHAVLQQDVDLPIWGTADAGEKVAVTLGNESASTTADANGKWRVTFPAQKNSSEPVSMTIKGTNTLIFQDILIGEVWLTSGQSNMEFPLRIMQTGTADAEQATDAQLRLFQVNRQPGLEPRNDFNIGQWVVCSPAVAAKFSALSYYFGRDLRTTFKRPVGIISTALGGTPVEAWISLEYLKKNPEFKSFVEKYEKIKAAYPEANKEYPAKKADYDAALAKWQKEVGTTFNPIMKAWQEEVKKARIAKQPEPPRPVPSQPKPEAPLLPRGDLHTPTNMFNGNIAPVIPYAIKGVVWYQGESNGLSADQYYDLFKTMVTCWRSKWNKENLPFLYVQLPRFLPGLNWPLIRDRQFKAMSIPHTGMVVAIDVGDPHDVHPGNKIIVSNRLLHAARHLAYGEKNLVWSGPIYDSMKVEGSSIRLSFTHVGGGLKIGSSPWIAPDSDVVPTDHLAAFTIAGTDKKWVPAEAKIDGNTIVVSSPEVPNPVAVRYGWENCPPCNLYNKEGLPAATFRTDDWYEPILYPPDHPNYPTVPPAVKKTN